MKSFLKTGIVLSCLTALISIACNKPEVAPASNSLTGGPPPKPSGHRTGNKEYFWGVSWDTTSTGFISRLDTYHLTQQAIGLGMNVYVAPWTEMSSFEKIPCTIYPGLFIDTVHVSYKVIPGQLQVMAQANFDMTKEKSDIYIEYK